ncbi:hypothetical protein TWF481_011540 [Arthrobotrys musiformis]|uniref:Uncharacterized protein n=1 Tax=Arthrobotrys musiformis TaxID=47236 RepID=A0AAV9W4M2_9PEZI
MAVGSQDHEDQPKSNSAAKIQKLMNYDTRRQGLQEVVEKMDRKGVARNSMAPGSYIQKELIWNIEIIGSILCRISQSRSERHSPQFSSGYVTSMLSRQNQLSIVTLKPFLIIL